MKISNSSYKNTLVLVGFILICQAAGFLGALFTMQSVKTWYVGLVKPPLTPPSWLFGPVWTALYVMMAVALWLIWKSENSENRKQLMIIFFTQLYLNAMWTPLFFGSHLILLALINIIVLLIVIVIFIVRALPEYRAASLLMLPYALWVGFATYLNAGFFFLNN